MIRDYALYDLDIFSNNLDCFMLKIWPALVMSPCALRKNVDAAVFEGSINVREVKSAGGISRSSVASRLQCLDRNVSIFPGSSVTFGIMCWMHIQLCRHVHLVSWSLHITLK